MSRVSKAATWGLLAVWAAHETEEVLTMARWLRDNVPLLRQRFPRVPERVWARLSEDVSPAQVRTAIGVMGLVMAAASAAGARTGGRSPFYQAALAGYGWHGVVHLVQSAGLGRYTPGVATSPVIVVPFAWWAWRELRRSGVSPRLGRASLLAGLLFPASLAGAHVVARAALKAVGAGPERDAG
ncbi:HXXEE domain-containing protein [Lentzea sp. NPDC055074]